MHQHNDKKIIKNDKNDKNEFKRPFRNEVSRFKNDANNEVNKNNILDIKLPDTWVFYDHEKNNGESYENCMRILGSMSLVSEYNFLMKKLEKPSALFYNKEVGKPYYEFSNGTEREISSISMFRSGIVPKWEDPKNINGGEVSIRKFNKKGCNDVFECIDEYWNLLINSCICESISFSKDITGIRIVDSSILSSKKSLYRIELWFSTADNKDYFMNLFKNLFKVHITDVYFLRHKT